MLSDILELLNLKIHLHGRFKARIRPANLRSVISSCPANYPNSVGHVGSAMPADILLDLLGLTGS